MAAIVLNHEQPHEKACSRHRKQQREPASSRNYDAAQASAHSVASGTNVITISTVLRT